MERPDWVPAAAWPRLEAALDREPAHALDALSDLQAASCQWDEASREALLVHFLIHAEGGVPLPAAFIRALADALEDHHE